MTELTLRHESWPLAGRFAISRGAKTTAEVVVVELRDGDRIARGECVPYARYGETIESVSVQIESVRDVVESGGRDELQTALAPGAARNALDCALWDLAAKQAGVRVWDLAGVAPPVPVTTAFTLGLDSPQAMGAAAGAARHRPLLKVKLDGEGDGERIVAIREAAPESELIVDANEGWSARQLEAHMALMNELGVAMIEQPLPAGDDAILAEVARPLRICADESCHDRASLEAIADRYDMINIKLDKTGGLSEALALVRKVKSCGLEIMVGCMLATSLAMAPALVIAGMAEFVDLDGPLLMAADREPGLRYEGSLLHPPSAELWG